LVSRECSESFGCVNLKIKISGLRTFQRHRHGGNQPEGAALSDNWFHVHKLKIHSTDKKPFRNLAVWFSDFVWQTYSTPELLPSPILVTRDG
jgi:hypothetical protein